MKKEFNFQQLQDEQAPWVKHNFGDRPAWMPLSGMSEEWGEYMEAWIEEDIENQIDAIADMVIFISDFCSALDINLQCLYELCLLEKAQFIYKDFSYGRLYDIKDKITVYIGKVNHSYLKHSQKIRIEQNHIQNIKDNLTYILAGLHLLATSFNINLLNIVEPVWKKVSQRDWKKNAKDGGRKEIE